MNRPSRSIAFSLFLVVALVNTILLLVVIPKVANRLDHFYNGDQYADGYDELASNMVSGNGYRFRPDTALTLMREPGYPLLLSGLFLAFGPSFAAVKLVNMLLAFGVAYLTMQIAAKLSNSWVLILGAPLIFLLHPGTLVAESRGGSEILFAFLLTLFLVTVYKAFQSGNWRDYLVSGAVLGLTVLVRSTPILFPLVLLAYLVLLGRREANSKIAALRNITVMVTAMFITISPWIIRNYNLTGKFVPTASVLGVSAQTGFYLATHHPIGNQGIDRQAAAERNKLAYELGYRFKDGYYQYFYSSLDEVKFSQQLLQGVLGQYKDSPILFTKVVGINLFNFWFGGRSWKSVALNAVIQIPLMVLATIGIWFSLKNRHGKDIAPFCFMIGYIVTISVPILALARYSVPLIPFLSILACVTLAAAHARLRMNNTGRDIDGFKAVLGGANARDAIQSV